MWDRMARVYVVDDVRDDIQRFTPDGKYVQTIGRHGTGDGEMNNTAPSPSHPMGRSTTAIGATFGSRRGTPRAASCGASDRRAATLASSPSRTTWLSTVPGRLYATDGGRVQVFHPDRSVLGLWSEPETGEPPLGLGAIVDSAGWIGLCSQSLHVDRIYKLRLAE